MFITHRHEYYKHIYEDTEIPGPCPARVSSF